MISKTLATIENTPHSKLQENHSMNETWLTIDSFTMNEMLELTDEVFKATIIKMLQQNYIFERSENLENISKEIML